MPSQASECKMQRANETAADAFMTSEVKELSCRLKLPDTSCRPLLALSHKCVTELDEGKLKRLFKEPEWGGVIIRCYETERLHEHLKPALEIARRSAGDISVFACVRIEAIANALGECFWEHESLRMSAHDGWKKLLPQGGYAFSLSVASPSHCITLCTPNAQLDERLSLPTGEYEFHIWRKRCADSERRFAPDAFERKEQLMSFLAPLKRLADGLVVDCSTLVMSRRFGRGRIFVRRMLESVFEESLSQAAVECGASEAAILRSVCYDPSLDADRMRLSFWRWVAQAYRRLFILPMMDALNELNMRFAIDCSGWRNTLSPFLAFGDIGQALRYEPVITSHDMLPMFIVSCNSITLRLLRALLGGGWIVAAQTSPEEGDELKAAFTAAKHGASAFVSDVFFSSALPEWLLASTCASAHWWFASRRAINMDIARMLCISKVGFEHSPAAVVISVRHMLSKLCMTRVRDEAANMISAWSELLDLLERFHLSCNWITDDDLASATIVERLPLQVALVSVERSGLRVGNEYHTTVLLPTPSGLSKAAWMVLSQLHEAGGSIFLVGAPPPSSEVIPETGLLKWVQSCSRSYEARFIYASELDMPLDDLSPVTYQSATGGCLGMFDWRICPDRTEGALMLHRMLTLSIRPMAETHHPCIKLMLRWLMETPIVLALNDSDELAEFHVRIRCVGRAAIWLAGQGGYPERYLHYAIVEDETDACGAMCTLIPLKLPPGQWCVLSIPPGVETHIGASNFHVTDVSVTDEMAHIKGYARRPNLQATICVGRKALEFDAHAECVPEDEAKLDGVVRVTGGRFEAVCVGELSFTSWRASFRFPWSLIHRRTSWHTMSGAERSMRMEHGERFSEVQLRLDVVRPPYCKGLRLKLQSMPEEWLAIAIDGKMVAANADADLRRLKRLRLIEPESGCKFISGCDTDWLSIEWQSDRHELVLWTTIPEGGEVKLPHVYVLLELNCEDPSLFDGAMLVLNSMSNCRRLHLMRCCECLLSILPPPDVSELLLMFDSLWDSSTLIGSIGDEVIASSLRHLRIKLTCDGERLLRVQVGEFLAGKPDEGAKAQLTPLRWRVAFGVNAVAKVRVVQ